LPRNPNIEILAITLSPPATTVDLSREFNQADGIAADGSTFSIKADQPTREAFEVYMAGRFRQTVTNLLTWNLEAGSIPKDQRLAVEQLMARRGAPTDLELKQAAAVVEPLLKGSALKAPATSSSVSSNPGMLYGPANPFLGFGFLPCFLAALFFRGGLVMRALGLEVVKKNGAKASRRLMAGRTFLAWFPVLMMGPLAQLIFLFFLPPSGLSSWELNLLNLGYILLTAGLMICAALLPERGLHDRMAGTCLVPRE
jgi:uncharacterized RDD family membrane protein YckC